MWYYLLHKILKYVYPVLTLCVHKWFYTIRKRACKLISCVLKVSTARVATLSFRKLTGFMTNFWTTQQHVAYVISDCKNYRILYIHFWTYLSTNARSIASVTLDVVRMMTLGNLERQQREQHITYVEKEWRNCRNVITCPLPTQHQMPCCSAPHPG